MTHDHPSKEQSVVINGIAYAHEDLFRVVNDFYSRIQLDSDLKVAFQSVHDWPEHIENLTHFWWIKFGGAPYRFNNYNPVAKHFFAGFNRELLTKWLSLFELSLKAQLRSEQVQLWQTISERMGEALFVKNELFKKNFELAKQD